MRLIHTWCYPLLQVTAVASYPLQSVLVRLRAALRVAFGSRNWKMTLDILHLAPSDRGLGLWMLEVYLYSTHASSFWRYLQHPTRFGFV